MITLYKRYIFWMCRMYQRTPGFRRWGYFLERQYTKRFWTTVFSGIAFGWLNYYASKRLTTYLIKRSDEMMYPPLTPEEEAKADLLLH